MIYPAAGLPSGAIREPRNCTLEPVYTRTAHDQNEDASLVAGHRVDQLCLHLDLRMGASARAILHAGLAEQADPADRPVDPRQRHRCDGAGGDGPSLGAARSARDRRKPSRRRQHHRHGRGRQGRARRLHHSRQLLDPHRDPGDPLESGVRDDRSRGHRPARQHACRDGVQSVEGLQKAQRLRRCGEGKARLGRITRRRAPAIRRISTASGFASPPASRRCICRSRARRKR